MMYSHKNSDTISLGVICAELDAFVSKLFPLIEAKITNEAANIRCTCFHPLGGFYVHSGHDSEGYA